ncbi:MAG: hypothetical protein KDA21_04290 [Phycisphaerales bacterium]|nr:hypothetical protein [Phycisphaerales bacterium]
MRIGLLVNPASGRGRAEGYARELAPALTDDGLEVEVCHLNPPPVAHELSAFVASCDGLVVVGGDGTLQSVIDAAVEGDTPVYHAPLGTENLFAREVGMTREIEQVRGALRERRIERYDVGRSAGSPFLMMLSVGFDAHVIHRLAQRRQGAITHLAYVQPILAELVQGSMPRLSIEVDGSTVVEDRPGLAVVANSRQYAMRIDPAPDASMQDGVLDVVFFPARWPTGLILWATRSRFRRHTRRPGLVKVRGRQVTIRNHIGRLLHQVDGEPGRLHPEVSSELAIEVQPAALSVLMPG